MVPYSLDLRLAFLPPLCSSFPHISRSAKRRGCRSLIRVKMLSLFHFPVVQPAILIELATNLTLNSGIVLEKVAEYFYYNYKNRNREDVPDMEIPPELCLELLMAADYLASEFS